MGDLVEIKTWPDCYNTFYKVTNSCISFEVKSSGYIGIGLAKVPHQPISRLNRLSAYKYWICIECNDNSTWISENCFRKETPITTPNILSNNEYRKFWISWYNDVIRLGRADEGKAIITRRYDTSNLNYVTFMTIAGDEVTNWRLNLPPFLDTPPFIPVTGGDLHWVRMSADSPVPVGAVIGGYDNETLYIARVQDSGRLSVGKFVPSKKMAYCSVDKCKHRDTEFEILCGYNFTWRSYYKNDDLAACFLAGYSKFDGSYMYVGRVKHKRQLIPGSVKDFNGHCFVSFDDEVIVKEQYEILIVLENKYRSEERLIGC